MYKLIELFKSEFEEVSIDYNIINDGEKKSIIDNYKKRHKLTEDINLKIEDVIYIKNFSIATINNFKYINNIKTNFNEQIETFKINGNNVVTKLIVILNEKKNIIKFCIVS